MYGIINAGKLIHIFATKKEAEDYLKIKFFCYDLEIKELKPDKLQEKKYLLIDIDTEAPKEDSIRFIDFWDKWEPPQIGYYFDHFCVEISDPRVQAILNDEVSPREGFNRIVDDFYAQMEEENND